MFCSHCGNKIDDEAKFCERCGAPVGDPAAEPPAEGTKVSPNITLGPDGKYRWTYEMSLFRNPTIFVLLWKILFIALAIVFLFNLLLNGCEGHLDAEHLASDFKILGIGLAGITVLAALGYLLYAAIMGGKYIVDFTMDEKGVRHAQAPAQAKKAVKLAAITAAAGAASGRLSTVGIGLMALRTEMSTEFARVKKVVAQPRLGVIKLNETFNHNQVYAHPEDFEFVMAYIRAHVPGRK
jgi:hypothetical protein